MNKKGESMT